MASRLLFLARHGEQEETGTEAPEVGLSARGRRQATLLGERLRGARLDAVHHGPLARTAETAALVAKELPGVPVHEDGRAGDHMPHDTDPTGLPARYAAFLAEFTKAERRDGPRVTAEAVARFATAPPRATSGSWWSPTTSWSPGWSGTRWRRRSAAGSGSTTPTAR
ncbi:histidine phosphatase family protein [Micromonospora maritima]|uniref:Histidine phosphatase family protein n=1 Tax=Micromonospora maritima TaxID=986711 RepID=A0ABW7ZPF7_9ACTN